MNDDLIQRLRGPAPSIFAMRDAAAEIKRLRTKLLIAENDLYSANVNFVKEHDRAERAEAERDALRERLDTLNRTMVRERDEADAVREERDALKARIEASPVGQSLGMVVYQDDENAAAKLEGERVALVVLEDE